jgi:hypothetical protein
MGYMSLFYRTNQRLKSGNDQMRRDYLKRKKEKLGMSWLIIGLPAPWAAMAVYFSAMRGSVYLLIASIALCVSMALYVILLWYQKHAAEKYLNHDRIKNR